MLNFIQKYSSDLIIFLAIDYTIVQFNPRAEKFYNWSSTEIIGKNFIQLCEDFGYACPVSDHFFIQPTLRYINLDSYNALGKHYNINWVIAPLIAATGQVEGAALLGQNITFKKNNIAYYLNAIINSIPGCIYWKDLNGYYLGCNDYTAKIAGLSSSHEIIGKTDWELWGNEAARLIEHDKQVIRSKESILVEEELHSADGTWFIFTGIKMPLKDENDQIIGIIGNSLDITELKNTQAELIQAKKAMEMANHAKTEFIANISHDIRTPLTGIITFSRYLKEQDDLDILTIKELAEDNYNASEQLLNLLNGILDMVSADTTTDNDLHKRSFDLMHMIDELIQLEKPAIKSHHLELKKSIDSNIPRYIISDKMKLHRILLNLIGNAIKFTEKGFIELAAKLQSKEDKKATVVFSVKDTGIGIPNEVQSQIFERFFKVKASYKGKYLGSGIGLHIVKKYVQLLDGEISFHSTHGKGTTFFITLTFDIDEVQKEEIDNEYYTGMLAKNQKNILLEKPPPIAAHTLTSTVDLIDSKLKILLVEDCAFALKALKIFFMPFKFQIMTAENAEDAFELVKKETFDLIITDIGLPGMQGDELIVKIRQLEKKADRSRVKIVAFTGHATDGKLADNCKKAGIDELFKKPMQLELLKNLIQSLI